MSDDKTRILTGEDAERWAVVADQADDKTRVLTGDEAARILARAKPSAAPKAATDTEDREPQFVGDRIVFFCPNGHRITVSRTLGGKRGNCSKPGCGAPVAIPVPPGFKPEPSPSAEVIARPPEPVAVEAEDMPAGPDALGMLSGPEEPAGDAPAWDFAGSGSPATADAAAGEPAAEPASGWTFDLDHLENPSARLVARLWMERAHGGVVEVHLSGGGVIMPEWYDPHWSSGSHAVFAALAADGTLTLTAVAWDQVQKVVVRQVQGTPDGMFEG